MIVLTVKYSYHEYEKFFETGKELQKFIKHKKLTYPGTVLRGNTLYINDQPKPQQPPKTHRTKGKKRGKEQ